MANDTQQNIQATLEALVAAIPEAIARFHKMKVEAVLAERDARLAQRTMDDAARVVRDLRARLEVALKKSAAPGTFDPSMDEQRNAAEKTDLLEGLPIAPRPLPYAAATPVGVPTANETSQPGEDCG